eukprot:164778_1
MSPKKNNTKSTHHGQKLKKKRRRSKSKIKNKTKYTATEHKFLTKNIHGEVDTKKLICKYKQKFTRSKRTDGALYQQITKMKKKMQAVVDQMEAVDDKISEVDHWNANEQYLFEDGIDHNLNYHNTNHSYSSPSPVLHRAPSPIFMPYIEENRNSLSLQQIPPIAPIPFMTQTPAPAPFLAHLPIPPIIPHQLPPFISPFIPALAPFLAPPARAPLHPPPLPVIPPPPPLPAAPAPFQPPTAHNVRSAVMVLLTALMTTTGSALMTHTTDAFDVSLEYFGEYDGLCVEYGVFGLCVDDEKCIDGLCFYGKECSCIDIGFDGLCISDENQLGFHELWVDCEEEYCPRMCWKATDKDVLTEQLMRMNMSWINDFVPDTSHHFADRKWTARNSVNQSITTETDGVHSRDIQWNLLLKPLDNPYLFIALHSDIRQHERSENLKLLKHGRVRFLICGGIEARESLYVIGVTAEDGIFEAVEKRLGSNPKGSSKGPTLPKHIDAQRTGNRVTCRDWFQLSLKEGLTVFRDQEFSSDYNDRGVERIDQIQMLQATQFKEDASPMAHAVRPDEYMEINNFYTVTVYEKGAEIVRMMETIIGREKFKMGLNLYLNEHDGEACTIEDFVSCMQQASGVNLDQFLSSWYAQPGTPQVTVATAYNKEDKAFTIHLKQSNASPQAPNPYVIPLNLSLLNRKMDENHTIPYELIGHKSLRTLKRNPLLTSRLLCLPSFEYLFGLLSDDGNAAVDPELLMDCIENVKSRVGYTL